MYYLQFSHLPMIEKNSFIFIYTLCFSPSLFRLHSLNHLHASFSFSHSLSLSHLQTIPRFSSDLIQIFARYSYFSQSPGRFPRSWFRASRDADRCCLPDSCIRIFLTGQRAFDSARSNYILRSDRTRPLFLSTSRFSGSYRATRERHRHTSFHSTHENWKSI